MTRWFDGELSGADVAALNAALAGSESARQEYIDAVYLREGMRKWAHSRGSADELQVINFAAVNPSPDVSSGFGRSSLASSSAEELVEGQRLASAESQGYWETRGEAGKGSAGRLLANRAVRATAIAAALLIAAGLYLLIPQGAEDAVVLEGPWDGDRTLSEEDFALSESDSVVARLTSATSDVRWARGRVPSDFLMRFRPGDILGIESGIAQVEFSGGAHLVLSSPTALQFTGVTSARLMHGSVTGRATKSNFTLVTPSATVVDIGTEFGVGVGPEGTDVTVFEGELQVHSLSRKGEGGPVRRMREGMSIRIDADGAQLTPASNAGYVYRRDLLRPSAPAAISETISLIDLIGGHDYSQARIAGSIDPRSGYWGKPPWLGVDRPKALRGDTQFTATPWNGMVDGVFIPRANAREMQIDSDGHVVHLPPNSGNSWGPIWARRLSEIDLNEDITAANDSDQWGGGTLEAVHRRLLAAEDGVLGLHANVGITFDLSSVREARAAQVVEFRALLLNMGASGELEDDEQRSLADLRVFVDGKLKFSRLGLDLDDGEAEVVVSLNPSDRFLTLVATDSDGDPKLDHVVFVDPVLRVQEAAPVAYRARLRDLYAAKSALRVPPLGL